jgi:hypothetical protein
LQENNLPLHIIKSTADTLVAINPWRNVHLHADNKMIPQLIPQATICFEVLMVELESLYLRVKDMQWCKIGGTSRNWTEQLDCSGKFIISLPPGE